MKGPRSEKWRIFRDPGPVFSKTKLLNSNQLCCSVPKKVEPWPVRARKSLDHKTNAAFRELGSIYTSILCCLYTFVTESVARCRKGPNPGLSELKRHSIIKNNAPFRELGSIYISIIRCLYIFIMPPVRYTLRPHFKSISCCFCCCCCRVFFNGCGC